MTWGLQSLQAVWWTAQPIQADPAALYQAMVGAASTATQSAGNTSVAMGQRTNRQYRVQRQANRLDFFVSCPPVPGVSVPLIDDIPAAIIDFKSKFSAACNQLPAVNRLAMVANVSEPAASVSAANQQVAELSGIELPYTDLSDIVLQLNRKKVSPTVANLQFNRVLKWLSESFQIIEVTAGIPDLRTAYLITVTVDVNTAPVAGRTFQSGEQITIFDAIGTEVERLCLQRNIGALDT